MSSNLDEIAIRKSQHIDVVLNKDVQAVRNSFSAYKLPYQTLPEIDFNSINTGTELFGKRLSFPFIISSMTGGPLKAENINRNLAIAAEEVGVGIGLGSMRIILKSPETLKSFDVRKYCPTIPLFGNIGLVQLNYGVGIKEINKLIHLIKADGIFLHVNA